MNTFVTMSSRGLSKKELEELKKKEEEEAAAHVSIISVSHPNNYQLTKYMKNLNLLF